MSGADGQFCYGLSRKWMSRQQLSHICTTTNNTTTTEATATADTTTTARITNTRNAQTHTTTHFDDFKSSPQTAELLDRSLQIIN
jgi:hypothetical protein